MAAIELAAFLPYRLNRLAEQVSHRIYAIYHGEAGLTRPEWRVLATLAEAGATTATAIGRHSAMHKTKVSRAVAALEHRRWLRRSRDRLDRRVEHLALTRDGEAAYARLAPRVLAAEAALIGSLEPTDRAALLAGLVALERALGIAPGRPPDRTDPEA